MEPERRKRRLIGIVFAMTLFPLSSVVAAVQPAQATSYPGSCPHGGNPNSTACLNNGTLMYGMWGTWHNNYTVAPSDGNHINNEEWGYTASDESKWVETGLRNGYDPSDPCNCTAYEAFWADFDNTPGGAGEIRHTIVNTSPDGTSHSYEVQHQCFGCSQWNVYYDYNYQATSVLQSSDTMYDHAAGLEDSEVTPATHADNFDNYMQYLNGSGSYVNWPTQYAWIDDGCNGSNNGYCLNGISNYGVNEWSDSKP
jgi:hypothetical protein